MGRPYSALTPVNCEFFMFERLLIANRGEIAVRIIRACKELGVSTVAVYSEADEQSLHVQLADEAICIGPGPSAESYLKATAIISAAEISDADAIHPGYGFLAESVHFAEICENCNLTFVGPAPDSIQRMGDKSRARETMRMAGVPVTPGSEGIVKSVDEALSLAEEIGYPVLIKAVSGGGGKGMRVAHSESDLEKAYITARTEADRAFGDPDVYMEKFVERARHIEVQIMGDRHGNVVHFGERDCSIQRRHQKLIEESPCPVLSEATRKRMCEAAVKAAQAVQYVNAGTIEFLYDEDTDSFYFMEMNTRIQVEHPVTEMVTGVDLIQEQIRVAAGQPLSVRQEDIVVRGHAFEFRVNAEDPYKDFTPSPVKTDWIHFPGGFGVRVDSHMYSGYKIPPYYDSMIAKVIVHARNREEARWKLKRALSEFMIEGPKTTLPLGLALLEDPSFQESRIHTKYLDGFMKDGFPPREGKV